MKITRSTIITGLAVLLLVAALPSAIREALETGRIYLFSWDFLADIPKRLTGPGRLRLILQPTVAIILGIPGGVARMLGPGDLRTCTACSSMPPTDGNTCAPAAR
jgi:hypothetical protein